MRKSKARWFTISVAMLAMILLTSASCSRTFEQILSVIPDTSDTRAWVAINDYVRMRREFHTASPSANATVEQQMSYLTGLLKLSSQTERLRVAATPGFFHDGLPYLEYSLKAQHNLGLGFWSIDQEVEAGRPPGMLDILKGRFDPETTRQTLAASAKDDPPSIETYSDNSTIFSWGEDNEVKLQKRLMPPAYDSLGRGGRFIVQSDYVFRTVETPGIKLLVDTQNGKHTSLSDVDEFRLMAKELSSSGALSAILSNQTQSLDWVRSAFSTLSQDKAQLEKSLAQEPILLRYQTIALAIAKDKNGLYALVILVHGDDQTAAKNVTLLRRRIEETNSIRSGKPWTSTISSSSIRSHGRVLTAKLYGDISRSWLDWYYQVDPLVLHE